MVETVNSLEDLCRLCAGKIDVLMGINIFDSDHRQIFKKITVCLPIQVYINLGIYCDTLDNLYVKKIKKILDFN